MWNVVVIVFNHWCHFLVGFHWGHLLLHMGCIPLLVCMPEDFFSVRPCKFSLLGTGYFYPYKYYWAFFLDQIMPLGKFGHFGSFWSAALGRSRLAWGSSHQLLGKTPLHALQMSMRYESSLQETEWLLLGCWPHSCSAFPKAIKVVSSDSFLSCLQVLRSWAFSGVNTQVSMLHYVCYYIS